MSNEQTTLRLARWLRGCKLPYDPQDVSDCADELERLATVEIEYGHLLAKVADLTLSLGASDRRVENHTRLIKGYQTELAPLRSELEAARGKVEALTAHVTVLTASLRATGVPQTLLDRMLADATHNP